MLSNGTSHWQLFGPSASLPPSLPALPPVLVAVVDARRRFLPDAQATAIHAAVLKGLKQRYATDNVTRVGDLPGGDPAAGPRP